MIDVERILLECRYLLSLKKSTCDLASIFSVSVDTINDDLNEKLKSFDSCLYQRVNKYLQSYK